MNRRNFLNILFASCFVFLGWLNFTPAANAMGGTLPSINQPAPEFTLPTNTGDGEISLSDYRGKWVVLYFYPKDFTAGCTIEARRFQEDLPKYLEEIPKLLVSAPMILILTPNFAILKV